VAEIRRDEMKSVVLDEVLSGKLEGGDKSVEILDSSGTVVGHYLTHIEYLRLQAEADFGKPLDPAYRQQAIQEMNAGRAKSIEELQAEFRRIQQSVPQNA
jgi:hypothetical protein